MSSPPSSSPAIVPGSSSGRFVRQRARVGPRPWSRFRKQLPARSFVLTAWPSCRGPRQPRGERIGGGPFRHARLTDLERPAGTLRATTASRHIPHPPLTPRTPLRAEQRRSLRPHPAPARPSGSALPLETGSEFPLGPSYNRKRFLHDLVLPHRLCMHREVGRGFSFCVCACMIHQRATPRPEMAN